MNEIKSLSDSLRPCTVQYSRKLIAWAIHHVHAFPTALLMKNEFYPTTRRGHVKHG